MGYRGGECDGVDRALVAVEDVAPKIAILGKITISGAPKIAISGKIAILGRAEAVFGVWGCVTAGEKATELTAPSWPWRV